LYYPCPNKNKLKSIKGVEKISISLLNDARLQFFHNGSQRYGLALWQYSVFRLPTTEAD